MTVKEYATQKFANVRDRGIVVREMAKRGFNEDSNVQDNPDAFLKNWHEVLVDLKKLYIDGLWK